MARDHQNGDRDHPWVPPDIVSLREYVEQRLDAAERTVENARSALAAQVQQRFAATEEAVHKTEAFVADRLKTITDALATLSVRAEQYITRAEMGALLEKFDERSAANVQRQIYELRGIAELRMTGILREIELREDGLNVRLNLLNQATEKAADALDRRLEGLNEFRQQLNDQALTFITRNEFSSAMGGAVEARTRLSDSLNSLASRVELAALAEKIDSVESAIDKAEGRRTVTTAIVALCSSLIVSLISGVIFVALNHK